MTRKSASRRAADAERAKANGGKVPSARVVREKTTRAWYELKTMHARSQAYIHQLADRVQQYMNPIVLMKIDKNGDKARFDELHRQLNTNGAKTAAEFEALWDTHKDKKKLCLSAAELEQAMRIADMYQAFDTDFYLTFSPIINELNTIFNKALKMLLDAKAELEKNQSEQAEKDLIDPTVVSDVNYSEVKAENNPLPAASNDLVVPVELKTAYENARLAGFVGTEREWMDSLKSPKGDVELGPNDVHVVGDEGESGVPALSSTSGEYVRELGQVGGHDWYTGPGGPKYPRDQNNAPTPVYVGDIPAAISSTPYDKEAVDDNSPGDEIVVDPNMRHGLIRPNI